MFTNRKEAGQLLAQKLQQYRRKKHVIVLGIPRGGVVVAKAVADKLNLPLDIIVVRKIGAPSNPELAIGAVGPQQTVYWDKRLCKQLGIRLNKKSRPEDDQPLAENLKNQKERERQEREEALRGTRKPVDVHGKTIILVDDGVATGATVLAAQKAIKKMGAAVIILAVPVIAKDTYQALKIFFDTIVVLEVPDEFYAVGQFYYEFGQVEDENVIELLRG